METDTQEQKCTGDCKHERKAHSTKMRRHDGGYDMACSTVNCTCMEFVAPKVKEERK